MLLKLAWRNIWRNTRRTLISVLALTLGVTAIVSIHSFREVAYAAMFRGITQGLVGHVQVHGRGYQESPDMTTVVAHPVAVEAKLAAALSGARTERRVVGAGLAGAGDLSTAVAVLGVEAANPAAEALLTVEKGRALKPGGAREAVIGKGLASELRVGPGDEMVLVGQAADGSLANDRFTVVGTADAGSSEANASTVFLDLPDAQSFFALGDSVHQIVVRLPTDEEDLSQPVAVMRGAVDLETLEVLSWSQMLPELKSAVDSKRKNSRFIDVVVFLIVSLGVLNTMTMSTFERTREFGVLASLGTRRGRVLGMVVLEALLQGAIGFCAGVAISWAILHGYGTANMNAFSGGTDMMGVRLPDAVHLTLYAPALVTAAITTLVTMLAGGLVPAVRASRLKPVEATRYV